MLWSLPTVLMKTYFLLLLAQGIKSASSDLYETILYTQYDEPSGTCNNDNSNPFFLGGDAFFNKQFPQLLRVVENHTAVLKQFNIKPGTLGPEAESTNARADLIAHGSNQIRNVNIMLGQNDDLIFCYENGVYRVCGDKQTDLYATSSPDWTYQYGCAEWQAAYTYPEIRFRSDSRTTKVVISVDLEIQSLDINQCPNSTDVDFADTANCLPEISQCRHIEGAGFVVGSYECQCSNCPECEAVSGTKLSDPTINATVLLKESCNTEETIGSGGGGDSEKDQTRQQDLSWLNQIEIYALFAVQSLCLLMCVIFAVLVIINRASPVIKSANAVILELILFGAALRYSQVLLRVTATSELTCLLRPWLAELSFIFMFGAVVLKIHKNLRVNQRRKGYFTDADLLRHWLICLVVTIIYLASWTATSLNHLSVLNVTVLQKLDFGSDGLVGFQCSAPWWNHITQSAETVFLAIGLFMAYRLRNYPSMFLESRWYTAVIIVELICSLAYYVVWNMYYMTVYEEFLMHIIYQQIVVTAVLLMIFCPKWHYIRNSPNAKSESNRSNGDLEEHVACASDRNSNQIATVTSNQIHQVHYLHGMDNDEVKKELSSAYEQIRTLQGKLRTYEPASEESHMENRNSDSKAAPKLFSGSRSVSDGKDEPEREPLYAEKSSKKAPTRSRDTVL